MKEFDVKCSWYEPLPFAEVDLRKLSRESGTRHSAEARLGVFPWSLEKYGHHVESEEVFSDLGVQNNGMSWPIKCTRHTSCEYFFKDEDLKLVDITRQYRSETGDVVTPDAFPIGAMSWYPSEIGSRCGNDVLEKVDVNEDGRCIFVVIPAHPSTTTLNRTRTAWWPIDCLTAGRDVRHGTKLIGKTWKRVGQPPNITVLGDIQSYLGFVGTVVDGRLQGRLLDEGPEEPVI
jgi:hypothetical protein